MKTSILSFLIFAFSIGIAGQIQKPAAPAPARNEIDYRAEVREAFEDFDFDRLTINPNNLTLDKIEELRKNYLPEVRDYIIDQGKPVDRLTRIARPIFLFHKSNKSRIVVIDYQVPTIFTWKETFVTFSTAALDLLTDDEIAALVAHEIGHLYFAERLAKAREDKNESSARVIELECDLIALLTLSKLNMKPIDLLSAVKKLIQARRQMQVGSFEAGSPKLQSREAILELFISREKRQVKNR